MMNLVSVILVGLMVHIQILRTATFLTFIVISFLHHISNTSPICGS